MFCPYVRSTDILGDNKPDVENILKNNDRVILSEGGKGTAVIISMAEYESLQAARYDKYVLQRLDEAEDAGKSPEAWASEEELLKALNV